MLANIVTGYLETRMPEMIQRVEKGDGRIPFIRIKAEKSNFGDIELYDEGDEVTIVFGRFTHCHFSNYDEISREEMAFEIAEDVYEVLRAVFSDELEFWGSHRISGGFRDVGYIEEKPGFLSRLFKSNAVKTRYRWSGNTRQV